MESVFISYSTDASKKAKSVSNYLSKLGVNSFVFEKNLEREVGNHQAQIRNEISNSNSIILILSVRSKDSPWVSHELGIALGLNKQIYVFKTSHNMTLPNYIDTLNLRVLNKLDELDNYYKKIGK
ncbi:hypothetical protein PE36_07422 [Moritella sp. PE36]|uniref:toll/interleukin-1 receptor domain-containing protein n=1 Tax=Moritella sp. PE36 TaxID=58051 RepID=UPI00015689D4|nr:toll/interleukin-1 receptor domain-containing protein [Moritella sp. PE36]EDM69299.1 hypothetical protein PE36_07422 [Moritella sp. PE36]